MSDTPEYPEGEAEATPPVSEGWITLREAEARYGVAIGTIRKWYGKGAISSREEVGPYGPQRLVLASEVEERAGALRGRERPAEALAGASPTPTSGGVLVPLDAWETMMMQLGNLHQAGQDLAEARERAAKAETEAEFLRERVRELRSQVETAGTPEPRDQGSIESASPRRRFWRRSS